MVINLTKDMFEKEVVKSEIPVLVDFWASWCGPCRMLGPVVEEVATEYDGKVKVCKVNVDEEVELATRFGVMTIPTCILFKHGEISAKTVGALSKPQLISQLGL
ncbi:MAG: thioredoxin [Eubacteriales bacterium]|jgi:thioredoxin 1|nr:thioredoxin [Eubacteriales bacterium]